MLLSFGVLLGLAVLLGLKLLNFGTAVSLALAIVTVNSEVSGERSHRVSEVLDIDSGSCSKLGLLHSTLSTGKARLVLHMSTLGRAIPQRTFTTAKP